MHHRKGRWTNQEDAKLKKLYNKYGPAWVKIGEEFGTRSSKQCRERWLGYLAPNLKKGTFDDEEAAITYQLYDILGPQWAKIAESLQGRTGNMVKNFYHNNQRQCKRLTVESSPTISSNEINKCDEKGYNNNDTREGNRMSITFLVQQQSDDNNILS